MTRVITGLLVVPTLYALAVVAGGFAGSLMALKLLNACLFAVVAPFLFHVLARLLRWTVQAPTG